VKVALYQGLTVHWKWCGSDMVYCQVPSKNLLAEKWENISRTKSKQAYLVQPRLSTHEIVVLITTLWCLVQTVLYMYVCIYFTFMLPCIVIYFLLNNQPDTLIIQIYSVIKLSMFWASSLPIIRGFLLYIRH